MEQLARTASAAFVFIPGNRKMTVYDYKGSILFFIGVVTL